MSGLPKYSRVADAATTESESLVKGGKDSFDEEFRSSYPPRAGPSSIVSHNVSYTFVPRYPVKGKKRHVMGVLGRTREETIDIVRRAFPELDQYPDERFEFEVGIDGSKEDWGTLMDDAWAQFAAQPPSRIKVQIADAPGDAMRRKRRDVLIILATIFGPFAGFMLFITMVFFLLDDSDY